MDLIWLLNDPNKQSLRDKFTNTYVVRVRSEPAGEGRIVVKQYNFLFFNCLFREVATDGSARTS